MFEYEAPETTPSLWQVRPRSTTEQRIVNEVWEAPAPVRTYLDTFGNACDRLTLPPGRSVLRYEAIAEVSSSFDDADKGATETPIEDLRLLAPVRDHFDLPDHDVRAPCPALHVCRQRQLELADALGFHRKLRHADPPGIDRQIFLGVVIHQLEPVVLLQL